MSNSKWSLYRERYGKDKKLERWVIRRWVDGKYKRMPIKKYAHLLGSEDELKKLVLRENAPLTTTQAVKFKHAFISPELQEEYKQMRAAQVSSTKNALCQYNYLVEYALNYFIGELRLPDPRQWYKVHKSKWAQHLLASNLSASTIRKLVQELNIFMEFLADQYPTEYVAIKFKPFSRQKLRGMAATSKLKNKRERFIDEDTWKELVKKLPAKIKSTATLCYLFGLRRSEALGLKLEDVYDDYLWVERQAIKVGDETITKGQEPRSVPYWFSSAKEAYELVGGIVRMSPDTFGDLWKEAVGGKFQLHDLRRTFITKAVRIKSAGEVKEAAGHKDLATTSRYVQQVTKHNSKRFIPKKPA